MAAGARAGCRAEAACRAGPLADIFEPARPVQTSLRGPAAQNAVRRWPKTSDTSPSNGRSKGGLHAMPDYST